MDHMIREAADQHHPAYDDKAWEKMEMLLDKHLPQKTDKRKFIYFLLLFLLLGSGTVFTIINFTGNKTTLTKGGSENKGDELLTAEITKKTAFGNTHNTGPQNENATGQVTGKPADNQNTSVPQEIKINNRDQLSELNKKSTVLDEGKSKMSITTAIPFEESVNSEEIIPKSDLPKSKNTVEQSTGVVSAANPEGIETGKLISNPANNKPEKNITDEQGKGQIKVNEEVKEKNVAVTGKKSGNSPEKNKSKRNITGNFGLTFSVGPDLSFVSLNKLGKATLAYGAGLSYNFAKRATVRTGFYFSKKIYTASPEQYHTPGGIAYPNLTEVDANCKVYEIPVSLSYNFGQRKNHNWFVATGLSSFLMKTEHYNYQYKTSAGQRYYYEKTINNANEHYFSVLSLSGGYQYRFNKRISLQAEPYVKLPLSGIGLGKIKLNSSGILFTLTVKPFAKSK